jgi:hypothetical protein
MFSLGIGRIAIIRVFFVQGRKNTDENQLIEEYTN